MTKEDKEFGVVGDIRIKEVKPKKNKNKKKKSSDTSIFVKIFVWFMFFAMLASFAAPLVYYFITYMMN